LARVDRGRAEKVVRFEDLVKMMSDEGIATKTVFTYFAQWTEDQKQVIAPVEYDTRQAETCIAIEPFLPYCWSLPQRASGRTP
jgi:hypothetical protein